MARLRGSRWQADALVDGSRVRKSFATEALAEAWEAKHKAAARAAEEAAERAAAVVEAETLKSLAKDLEVDLWGRGDNAVRALQVVDEATVILGAELTLKNFKAVHVQKLTNHWLGAGLADGTINRKMAILRKLCRRAVDTEVMDKMPKFPIRKEPKGRDRYLTADEEDRILDALGAINPESRDLVIFLVDTGCRLGEAFSLEWYQVNLDANTVTFDKTKADLTRTVSLTSRVREILKRYGNAEKPFTLNRYTFRDHWNRAKVIAGFKGDPLIVPHIMRHTCASRIVQDGLGMKIAQTQLGHKVAATTDRYAHLAPDALKPVVATLERRGQRA